MSDKRLCVVILKQMFDTLIENDKVLIELNNADNTKTLLLNPTELVLDEKLGKVIIKANTSNKVTLNQPTENTAPQPKVVEVYCDGGCRGNMKGTDNLGAWAYHIKYGDKTIEDFASVTHTTNNRMEMTALLNALRKITRKDLEVIVHLDSDLTLKGITQWYPGWIRNNWKNSKKQDVANRDLWELLIEEKEKFSNISFVKVKGHSDNEGNNRVDLLCNIAMDSHKSMD